MTAKNTTEQVKEEILQTKAKVDAEAYSLKIKKESVTKDLIELKKAEAFINAIEKWDGHLPTVMGISSPFINLLEPEVKK